MNYRFLDYELNAHRHELTGPGGAIPLQPQAFALLVFLVENADRVVSKDEVFDSVWEGRPVGDSTLNARINAIRKALGDDGSRQEVIRTVPRKGFRFVAPVLAESLHIASIAPADGPQKTLAVLPFTDFGRDPDQAYFADGLTEDLIPDLAKVPDLFVIARNTAFSFKGSSKTTSEIAQEMGVAHVLEGSVRRAGDRLRINAQLVDAARGGPIWAERYDRSVNDIFAVQDDITAEITSALKSQLRVRHSINQGGSAKAYDLCMRARALFYHFEPQALTECIALLEDAVHLEPGYCRAWAEQVFPYQNAYTFGFPGFEEGLQTAIEKGRYALQIDAQSGFALSRLGFALTMSGQHEVALDYFRRAVELEPQNTDVLAWYCEALNFAGQPEEAIEVAERCLQYDPVAPPNVLHHLAHSRFLLGDTDGPLALEPRVLSVVPAFLPGRLILIAALVEASQPKAAHEEVARLHTLFPDFTVDGFSDRFPYRDPTQAERIATALAAADLE